MREWLKEIRVKEGLTQKGAAITCGISQQFYNYIERGARDPHQKMAREMAIAMHFEKHGASWSWFFEGAPNDGRKAKNWGLIQS